MQTFFGPTNQLTLTFTLVFLQMFCLAQENLVPNGSFEDVSHCPLQSHIIDAAPWQATGGGTSPDLFNECFPPLIVTVDTIPVNGVPINKAGQQQPHTGYGYAGIYVGNDTVYSNPGNVREYLQIPLLQPLSSRIRYEVSFYVSLADKFWYGIGTLGAYFSEERVERNDYFVFEVEPSIESSAGDTFTDKENWIEVRDTFVSRAGGEKWLLIGNFRTDIESQLTFVDSGAGINYYKSYCYIDDVSVIALDSVPSSIEEQEPIGLSVYPNPSSQFVHVRSYLPIHSIRLFDLRGREVMVNSTVGGRKYSLDVCGLPAGMYLIEIKDKKGRRATERIIKTDGP